MVCNELVECGETLGDPRPVVKQHGRFAKWRIVKDDRLSAERSEMADSCLIKVGGLGIAEELAILGM